MTGVLTIIVCGALAWLILKALDRRDESRERTVREPSARTRKLEAEYAELEVRHRVSPSVELRRAMEDIDDELCLNMMARDWRADMQRRRGRREDDLELVRRLIAEERATVRARRAAERAAEDDRPSPGLTLVR